MSGMEKNMNVLAYANGFTLWHYQWTDDAADPMADAAFDAAASLLKAGDVVLINRISNGRATARLAVVGAVSGGSVRLAALGA